MFDIIDTTMVILRTHTQLLPFFINKLPNENTLFPHVIATPVRLQVIPSLTVLWLKESCCQEQSYIELKNHLSVLTSLNHKPKCMKKKVVRFTNGVDQYKYSKVLLSRHSVRYLGEMAGDPKASTFTTLTADATVAGVPCVSIETDAGFFAVVSNM